MNTDSDKTTDAMVIALRKELGHFTALLTLKLVMQHLAKDREEYEELVESVAAAFRDRCKKYMDKELAGMETQSRPDNYDLLVKTFGESHIISIIGTDRNTQALAFEDALNQVCSEFRNGLGYTEDYR